MRVLLSGGGTGGHINPALAIGGEIRRKNPGAVVEYIGTKRGLEGTLVPKEGYRIHYIDVRGLQRRLTVENLAAAIKAITSYYQAKKIIKQFKPDIVIGTGGYVCWPVLRAASAMKIPTMVHEQNAFPGLAVKRLQKHVDKVLVSFAESKALLGKAENAVLVGNPVKAEMISRQKTQEKKRLGYDADLPLILSYGGSLGARRINETIFGMIKRYSLRENLYHIHATGAREWELFRERYIGEGFQKTNDFELKNGRVTVREYLYDMPSCMAAADIVICRAGAMTLSELAVMGKASVIIPSPNVTNNHQYKNAHVLEKAGAAILIEEKDLSPERLIAETSKLARDNAARIDIENKIRHFAIPDSLDRIYRQIEELMKKANEA